MSRPYLIAILLLQSFAVNAQELRSDLSYKDLSQPNYIYSLDEDNVQARGIAYSYAANAINTRYCSAILFKNKLYKHVNFNIIYPNSELKNYSYKLYTDPRKIKKFTKDPDIIKLHVIGKERPGRE